MMPILYAANATSFDSNGLGGLSDAIECTVEEERNGAYTLTLVYPVDGAHYSDIALSSLIKADCGGLRGSQMFRVYKMTRPMAGRVTIYANHLSYQLSLIPCAPFTAASVGAALAGLKANAAEACPFEFSTDKATVATYTQTVPESIRSRLGGVQGSILDVYGGEFEFDNYSVKLWANRGADRGVTLRYGKNITDLTQEENIENTITGVYPYWANDVKTVTLPEKVISAASASAYPFPRTVPLDCSSEWQDEPTEAQLRAYATAYVSRSGVGVPAVSMKVSFVNLRDTEEYADVAALESVELCDYVTVIFEKLGVNSRAQVVKTAWDVLAERYTSVEIGSIRTSLAVTISDAAEEAAEAVTPSALASAVAKATERITGNTGGYIKYSYNADGEPYEMLIMDAPDEADAVNIWRYNAAGWGFSRNGGQTYTTAATLDGGIVADFITAGTLTGLSINNGNGTFRVDSSGNVTANSLSSSNATITGGSININSSSETNDTITLNSAKAKTTMQPSGLYVTNTSSASAPYLRATINGGGIFMSNSNTGNSAATLTTTDNWGRLALFNAGGTELARLSASNGSLIGGALTLRTASGGASVSLQDGVLYLYGSNGNIRATVSATSNSVTLYDSSATRRVLLDATGLKFYNSSGTLTKTYSAT